LSLRVFANPRAEKHETGPHHPERAQRLEAFAVGLERGGLLRERFAQPSSLAAGDLEAVHPSKYVALVRKVCEMIPEGAIAELPTGDTVISHESYEIAISAAAGAVDAVEAASASVPSLALVRPPGHHAEPARGMGFCLFNNVAVGAARALRTRGNVLIVDFDYHHGNGTQAWVERVLETGRSGLGFVSTHAYPAYPGTGAFDESRVEDHGFIIDIPLNHATDTEDFIHVWSHVLPLAARKLRPKIIVVSAGFDFLAGDPIAGLSVGPRAVDALCALLGSVAAEHDAPLAFVLEGGYSLDNLRASGESLARVFGVDASTAHVPAAAALRDPRLHGMTDEIARWLG
jgi:acetoin utilization deacetylase AcuC-like enzyme